MMKHSFDDYKWHVDPESGCWIWDQYTCRKGYGQARFGKKNFQAHRLFWHFSGGKLTPGMVLHHDCQNPSCVNPFHLREVTDTDNIRMGKNVRLTMEDARFIRTSSLRGRQLAQMFGIREATVSQIRNNKRWRE